MSNDRETDGLRTTTELALDLVPDLRLAENHTCPRCGSGVPNDLQRGAYPGAISRYMGEGPIEVCSACGTEEAIIQWQADDPQIAVHPTRGVRPWVSQPI